MVLSDALTKKKKRVKKDKSFTKKQKKCSPVVEDETISDYSCYTKDILIKLKNKWNDRHDDVKIKTTNPKKIWNFLDKNLKNVCEEEKCWLKQDFVDTETKNNIEKLCFTPKIPDEWKADPNAWLSSVDIINVMKQYEKKYKCFRFIGPSPIDFDTKYTNSNNCVWDELCNFSLKKYLKKKIKKIGIIFNLDKHTGPGTHWVSFFINIPKKILFYFNSTGQKVPLEIKNLRDKIIKQGEENNIKFDFCQNTKEHQKSNTECGMYSLFFTVSMITDNKSIKYFREGNIPDNIVEQYRGTKKTYIKPFFSN